MYTAASSLRLTLRPWGRSPVRSYLYGMQARVKVEALSSGKRENNFMLKNSYAIVSPLWPD
jgi:hypothetical protein